MNFDQLFIAGYRLPSPLSKNEVYELLKKIEIGDELAKEKLAEHNIRLVFRQVMSRFKTVDYDKADLISIGNIGLIKAINTFDINKEIGFSSYATRCIDNEILMFLRKLKKNQNIDSLDKTINYDKEGNELKIGDTIYDDIDIEEEYTDNETYEALRQIVEKLPDRDREIIMMHFGFYDDRIYTQQEIGDKFNFSRAYISKLIQKIVKKIGYQLQQQEFIELRNNDKREKKQSITANFRKEEKLGLSEHTQKEKEEKTMAKELQTIYEYFNKYNKEEIDTMLTKLTEEEINLITLRYGDDLNNPKTSEKWNKDYTKKFYGCLIPKMARLLANPNKVRKPKDRESKVTINETVTSAKEAFSVQAVTPEKTEELIEKQISPDNKNVKSETIIKEDYMKILELFETSNFKRIQ